ncbi:MAG: DNA gyrase/topoisomerase IV subunit A [Chitinophagaceae bacterium]|nr:DNA gyrase/topoisomerase IV subunit A [Oligoflexus sp.]
MSDKETPDKTAARPLPHVEDLYQSWFLEYASYVILDRAVPDIRDGLKPVQRRILHALWELDDGRLNKAANVIGHTMRYHPHGDMAIEDALVKIAQKELLIDMQGNWGNVMTGDRAAAPRYIEARISTLAKEIIFNEEITNWQSSYDGRNKEPQYLPVKFPLLLAHGVEGIAVGLSTRILPHNFVEICDAAISHLKDKPVALFPDFPTGGVADFSLYKDGQRGGKVRVRARMEAPDSKTLLIKDIPFGTTTTSVIESILAAHDKGKIKVKKVEDNTSQEVEILVKLPPGVSVEQTEEALYAFTDCEVSISTYACVISEDKPLFCSVNDLLVYATNQTKDFLGQELSLHAQQLRAKIHKATLESLFIEHKIYRKIEGAESWEDALDRLAKTFKPLLKQVVDEVTPSDYEALLEIRFKRLTKYDNETAEKALNELRGQMKEVEEKLSDLTKFTIKYFESLKKKYGARHARKTLISGFSEVRAREVVLANHKLYVNRESGFIGTSLKNDEFVTACSDMDEFLILRKDGQIVLSKVSDKVFVGEGIDSISILPSQANEVALHVLYQETETGSLYAKRLKLTGMQRDKAYELLKSPGKIIYTKLVEADKPDWLELERLGASKSWLFNFQDLDWTTRAAKGQLLTVRDLKSFKAVEESPGFKAPISLTLSADGKQILIGGKGKKIGSFAPSQLLIALTDDGFLKVFPAAEKQVLSSPLKEVFPLASQGILTVVARHKDMIFARRLKSEDLAEGMELPLFEGRELSGELILMQEAVPLLELQFMAKGALVSPPEILPLADHVPTRSLTGAVSRINRPGISVMKAWVKP